MKVFCKQCKYCKIKPYEDCCYGKYAGCRKHKFYSYNSYNKTIHYADSDKININNDCEDFEYKFIYKIINFVKSLFQKENGEW